ncbi:hypothetical protein JOC54_002677 [Alkalihalobacillus xiaoxiensis]|uniref:Uncharacterized protein n=1 Tax=Shouchella xiaoxiensis TaxID=766895 RepID=A0ABS2SYV2_9BACI|nr:hypothetical protein [Shouchella xiaoxiensis]
MSDFRKKVNSFLILFVFIPALIFLLGGGLRELIICAVVVLITMAIYEIVICVDRRRGRDK